MNTEQHLHVSPHGSNTMLSAVSCRLTKAAISKIINWSTSRYNVIKKPDVVNEIYNGMLEGGIWIVNWKEHYKDKWQTRDIEPLMGKERIEYLLTEREYHSGSYCECSSMSRTGTYKVDFTAKTILSVEDGRVFDFKNRCSKLIHH